MGKLFKTGWERQRREDDLFASPLKTVEEEEEAVGEGAKTRGQAVADAAQTRLDDVVVVTMTRPGGEAAESASDVVLEAGQEVAREADEAAGRVGEVVGGG